MMRKEFSITTKKLGLFCAKLPGILSQFEDRDFQQVSDKEVLESEEKGIDVSVQI